MATLWGMPGAHTSLVTSPCPPKSPFDPMFRCILFKTHLLGWDWYDMPVYRMAITSTQKHQCPSKGTPWALCTQPRSAVWGYFTPVLLIIHTSGTPYFHNVHQCDRLESISVSPISLGCGSMCARTSQVMFDLHSAMMDHHMLHVPQV